MAPSSKEEVSDMDGKKKGILGFLAAAIIVIGAVCLFLNRK